MVHCPPRLQLTAKASSIFAAAAVAADGVSRGLGEEDGGGHGRGLSPHPRARTRWLRSALLAAAAAAAFGCVNIHLGRICHVEGRRSSLLRRRTCLSWFDSSWAGRTAGQAVNGLLRVLPSHPRSPARSPLCPMQIVIEAAAAAAAFTTDSRRRRRSRRTSPLRRRAAGNAPLPPS